MSRTADGYRMAAEIAENALAAVCDLIARGYQTDGVIELQATLEQAIASLRTNYEVALHDHAHWQAFRATVGGEP